MPADLPAPPGPLQIWCFLDGKRGHENQSLGLIDALRRQSAHPIEVHRLPVSTRYPERWVGGASRETAAHLPAPDLLIGAGHATHVPLWRARRRFGGRSIVLMKPTLPLRLFDLCLIPDAHRIDATCDRVLVTCGVLNRIQPSSEADPRKAICLIGGPSSHYRWSGNHVVDQLRRVLADSPAMNWQFATSRRTPAAMHAALAKTFPQVPLQLPEQAPCDWLPRQLQRRGTIWVTEDSVSMTYEAVTAGGRVGILELERAKSTRVTRSMDRLADSGRVTRYRQWRRSGLLPRPGQPLRESDRAAAEILRRFFPAAKPAAPQTA